MKTPSKKWIRPVRGLRSLFLTLAVAAAAFPAGAAAFVTPEQATDAAERGAGWFEATQAESGALKGDWAMTALAATGVNAADVRVGLLDPSAQDYYLGEWQASGPGGAATDAERGILAGVAGGIQPSRLAAGAETVKSNLVARVAELFDGTQVGTAGLLNDDIFAVLALDQAGAPQPLLARLAAYLRAKQLPNGGWSWSASAKSADTDMTGAAVGAFCAAGVSPADPDVAEALALLHTLQDPASGGFSAPPPFGVGVNADTTAWVASGLIRCGIDPQSAEWTTAEGKTPLDYLVSLQQPDGHFKWTASINGGAMETYNAVRPLAGAAFSSQPPARLDGSSPAVRPAAAVEDGTTVPVTLVIDHGPAADDVRMCRVDVPSGSNLGALLAAAESASVPSGCVSGFETRAAEGGGTAIDSLDGVAASSDYRWTVRVDGGAASAAGTEPVGFGDLVFLQYGAFVAEPGPVTPVEVPPLGAPAPQQAGQGQAAPAAAIAAARVAVAGRARWRDGALAVVLACPRGVGAAGCSGLLTARFRPHPGGRLRLAGSSAFQLAAGSQGTVELTANRALRRRLAEGGRVKLQLIAVTRGETGEAWLTRAGRFVQG